MEKCTTKLNYFYDGEGMLITLDHVCAIRPCRDGSIEVCLLGAHVVYFDGETAKEFTDHYEEYMLGKSFGHPEDMPKKEVKN